MAADEENRALREAAVMRIQCWQTECANVRGEDMRGDVPEELLGHMRSPVECGLETAMPRVLHCETFQVLYIPLVSISSGNISPSQFIHDALERMIR